MLSTVQELMGEPEIIEAEDPEQTVIVSGISWANYEALLTKLDDNTHYRLTYLDGVLEIVSPSLRHENIKKRLAILLERYLYRKRIPFKPMGSSTLRKQLKQAGVEPDECYAIREIKDVPNLAIEVTVTSGGINKLETYLRLGISEVWFWSQNKLSLYVLREVKPTILVETSGYEKIVSSEILLGFNIPLLEDCISISDEIQAIDEFEQGIAE
jgi:Uma2 family endonuclease